MLKGYKTVLFNLIMGGVAWLAILSPQEAPSAADVSGTIDAVDTAVVALWTLGNWVIRAFTTAPIFNVDLE